MRAVRIIVCKDGELLSVAEVLGLLSRSINNLAGQGCADAAEVRRDLELNSELILFVESKA
jgi:hypothetical protein